MNNRLRLLITPKAPDFNYVPKLDIWCSYIFQLETNHTSTTLVYHEWDFYNFCEWALDHVAYWYDEQLKIEGYPDAVPLQGESLCQAFNRLQDTDFEDEDAEYFWHVSLDHYWKHHCILAGLWGAAIPGMFIGDNHGGEISLCNDNGCLWRYSFEMDAFVGELLINFDRILRAWLLNSASEREQDLYQILLNKLENVQKTFPLSKDNSVG
jgi:hypothetical protein